MPITGVQAFAFRCPMQRQDMDELDGWTVCHGQRACGKQQVYLQVDDTKTGVRDGEEECTLPPGRQAEAERKVPVSNRAASVPNITELFGISCLDCLNGLEEHSRWHLCCTQHCWQVTELLRMQLARKRHAQDCVRQHCERRFR